VRGTAVAREVSDGAFAYPSPAVSTVLGAAGALLGLATAVVVVAI
jgi:hypothetical protein